MQLPILLDSNIRDFVFIPLIIMIFLLGVVRIYAMELVKGPGSSSSAPSEIKLTKEQIHNENVEIDFAKLKQEIPEDVIHT